MKYVRVTVSKAVLETFFKQIDGRAISIVDGIPADAKMISFKHDVAAHQIHGVRQWIAIFEHESFKDIEPGSFIPEFQVTFQILMMNQKAEQPPAEPEIKSAEKMQ